MMILAYVLNLLGLLALILASLIKGEKIKKTLFLVTCGNLLVAVGYLCGGKGFNGAVTSFLAGGQALINYFFDAQNKPLPKWLIGLYALSFVGVNIWLSGVNFLSILAILAAMTCVMGLIQKNGAGYRFWTLLNCILWSFYDIFSKAYNGLIVHATMLIITLAGMILNDRKQTK